MKHRTVDYDVQEVQPGPLALEHLPGRPNRSGTAAFSNAGKSGGGLYGRDQ